MPRKTKPTQAAEELAPFVIPPEAYAPEPGPYMTDEAQDVLLCGTIAQAFVNRYMAAPLAEVIEACDLETDVARLGEASMLCDGELKDQIEQRIAVILRGAPIDGRVIASGSCLMDCVLADEEALTEIRSRLDAKHIAEGRLEAAREVIKYAKLQIEESDEAIEKATRGTVERMIDWEDRLVGDKVTRVRMDTGLPIREEREATATELQEPIPFDDADPDTDEESA